MSENNSTIHTHKRFKEILVKIVIKRINRCDEFKRLKLCIYDELSKFGLIIVAVEEGIFSRKLWREKNKDKIFKMVEMFLTKHI